MLVVNVTRVEVWMDDWETLAIKYNHVQAAKARGVGFWTADATMLLDDTVVQQMWAAVL